MDGRIVRSLLWTLALCLWGCEAHYSKDRSKPPEPSIICYDCNSAYDPRCGDPFDNYTIGTVNCTLKGQLAHLPNLKPSLCRKIVQLVEGQRRVIRGCGYIKDKRDDKTCIRRTGTKGIEVNYCSCTGSLCNGATGPAAHTAVAILVAAAAAILVAA